MGLREKGGGFGRFSTRSANAVTGSHFVLPKKKVAQKIFSSFLSLSPSNYSCGESSLQGSSDRRRNLHNLPVRFSHALGRLTAVTVLTGSILLVAVTASAAAERPTGRRRPRRGSTGRVVRRSQTRLCLHRRPPIARLPAHGFATDVHSTAERSTRAERDIPNDSPSADTACAPRQSTGRGIEAR